MRDCRPGVGPVVQYVAQCGYRAAGLSVSPVSDGCPGAATVQSGEQAVLLLLLTIRTLSVLPRMLYSRRRPQPTTTYNSEKTKCKETQTNVLGIAAAGPGTAAEPPGPLRVFQVRLKSYLCVRCFLRVPAKHQYISDN